MHVFRLKIVTFEALWCQNEFGEGGMIILARIVILYNLLSFQPCVFD